MTDSNDENADKAQNPSDIFEQMSSMLGEAKRMLNPSELAKSATNLVGNTIKSGAGMATPAWKQVTEGESRWASAVGVALAAVLQLLIPQHLAVHPRFLLPGLIVLLLAVLLFVSPDRMGERSVPVRFFSLALIALVSAGNIYSGARLVTELISGTNHYVASELLRTGGCVWFTNVIVFSLWYWEFDRGGPAARALAIKEFPDFMFPQMQESELAPPDWEAKFADYFYMSFTNATAFSPTDVMPLTRWAKMTMLTQSAVSLSIVALVVARAVNILGT